MKKVCSPLIYRYRQWHFLLQVLNQLSMQALSQGNSDGARIYAQNAIRKRSEYLNLLRLSSRIDAVASRVETAVTMRQLTGNMTNVVRGMDKAMDNMNIEQASQYTISLLSLSFLENVEISYLMLITPLQISRVMDKFETQFSDLDVQTSYMEDTISSTTAVSTPQDQVDLLMRQLADEANIEISQEISSKNLDGTIADLTPTEKIQEEDSNLAERLRALRPAV